MFLLNVMLARTLPKAEYGIFVLSYSIFTFLGGLHNAALLEPYTVYGAGRYHSSFRQYLRAMLASNVVICGGLTALLLAGLGIAHWAKPDLALSTMFGLSLGLGVMLTAGFVRRTFYIEQRPRLAACTALLFFAVLAFGVWWSVHAGWLSGFSVFLIVALSWMIAWLVTARDLIRRPLGPSFLSTHPQYWREHWQYTRWVLATCLVFQLSSQGYYWLVAGYVSTREVADLRAMYMLVSPVEQLFVAFSYLMLPRMALHFALGRTGEFLKVWKRYCWLVVIATTGMAIMVRLFGRPIVHRLYAGKYDSSIHLLFLCSLVPILTLVGNTMNDGLKAAERPKMVFYAYCVSGAATFMVGIPLVKYFGVIGAAYGMLVSAGAFAATLALPFVTLIQQSPRFAASPDITVP